MDMIQLSHPHSRLVTGGTAKEDIPSFLSRNLFRNFMQQSRCQATRRCKRGRELQSFTWVAMHPAKMGGSAPEGEGINGYWDRPPVNCAIRCINSFIHHSLSFALTHVWLYHFLSCSWNAPPQFLTFPRLAFYDFFSLSRFPLMFVLTCFYRY